MRSALLAFGLLLAGPAQAVEGLVGEIESCLGRIGDPGEHPELCMCLHVTRCIETEVGLAPGGEVVCIDQETDAWSRILTAEYTMLLGRLGDDQRASLRDSQRKWTAFLEADCEFPLIFEKSALARPWAADCRLQHTARRAMELRGYLNYLAYTE